MRNPFARAVSVFRHLRSTMLKRPECEQEVRGCAACPASLAADMAPACTDASTSLPTHLAFLCPLSLPPKKLQVGWDHFCAFPPSLGIACRRAGCCAHQEHFAHAHLVGQAACMTTADGG